MIYWQSFVIDIGEKLHDLNDQKFYHKWNDLYYDVKCKYKTVY